MNPEYSLEGLNAVAPIPWPPDEKSQLIGKDLDAEKDWREEKGATENAMGGWHHWLNGMSLSKSPVTVKGKEAWCAMVRGVAEGGTWPHDWTTTTSIIMTGGQTSHYRASLVAQTVKNPPAMQETWVQPLGWEDSLEKGMATHTSILAWRIPRTEETSRIQSMGSQSWTWPGD